MANKQMRVMHAYKDQGAVLSAVQLYNEIWPVLKNDPVLLPFFSGTEAEHRTLFDRIKTGKCKSCQISSVGDVLIKAFVRDLKSAPKDKQEAALSLLHKRTVVGIGNKWVNLATNEVSPIQYEIAEVPDPKDLSKPAEPVGPESEENLSKPAEPADPVDPEPEEDLPEGARPTETPPWQVQPPKQGEARAPQPLQRPAPVPALEDDGKRRVILQNFQAPGDVVMITAAVRDLHVNHPGKFLTDVRTSSMSIWESNPYITKLDENDPRVEVHKLEYPLIHHSNQGPWHFSEAFTEEIEDKLGVRIKRRLGKGDVHIGPNEEAWGSTERSTWFGEYGYDPEINYWILNAGYKNDFTCKMWPEERYQRVVDHFHGQIVFVQVGHKAHNHPNLEGVINLVGKTDDRQLIRLVWSSSGVVTPVSYPMTLAAAVPVRVGKCLGQPNRPCVVIAGGREPNQWQTHANHQFIHCCGALPCCPSGGCWASRIKPIGDDDDKDRKNMCKYVVKKPNGDELPYCMDMITAEEVIRRMEIYLGFFTPGRPRTHTYNK